MRCSQKLQTKLVCRCWVELILSNCYFQGQEWAFPVRSNLCVIPVQYPSFIDQYFPKSSRPNIKVGCLRLTTFGNHHSPAQLAILVLLPIRTLFTYCSSRLRIEHAVSPENTAKQQHTGDEALAHFLLSINRGNIHTHAQITPPSSPICHNEILMPLLLLGNTYTCTSTLCYAQHAYTHSGTPMHTHPPSHLTRG